MVNVQISKNYIYSFPKTNSKSWVLGKIYSEGRQVFPSLDEQNFQKHTFDTLQDYPPWN